MLQFIKSLLEIFWAELFRDLHRKGRKQISFSHQQHAEFDILLLTVVTARILVVTVLLSSTKSPALK